MTHQEHLKCELMIYAISCDYFGYGSTIIKQANNYFRSTVDGETFINSATQLAHEFVQLTDEDKTIIVQNYLKNVLLNEGVKNES